MWREAGPPPDLATRLFTERIMYLVCQSSTSSSGVDPDSPGPRRGVRFWSRRVCPSTLPWQSSSQRSCSCWCKKLLTPFSSTSTLRALRWVVR